MHGRSDRNFFSPLWIVSKGPSGRWFLVGFDYAVGSFAGEMDRSEVETGARLLGKAKRD